MDDYSYSRTEIAHLKKRMFTGKTINAQNKKYVENHVAFLHSQGSNDRTVLKHLYCLRKFFEGMQRAKLTRLDLAKATKQDMQRILAEIESSDSAPETKRNIKAITKSFFKHEWGDDLSYPSSVLWIKTTLKESQRRLPEEILNESDVMKLISAAKSFRDRAVIALLWDSGIRIGELITMRIKDIDLSSDPATIQVTGKTGPRKIPITFSLEYIVQYMNGLKEKDPNNPMWVSIFNPVNKDVDGSIEYRGLCKMLAAVGRKAKITKRCNPHSFRHGRGTFYARTLSNQVLKEYFGWKSDSTIHTYTHLSNRDITNEILKANGMKQVDYAVKPSLSSKECPRCKMVNPADNLHCQRCGCGLDPAEVMHDLTIEEATQKILRNPKLLAVIKKAVTESEQPKEAQEIKI